MSGTIDAPTPVEEFKTESAETTLQATSPEAEKTAEVQQSAQEIATEATQLQTNVEATAAQNEVLTQLLDVNERMQEVESRISRLSNSIQAKDWEVHISADQLAEMSRVDELLAKTKIGLTPESLRSLMMLSPDYLDDFIERIKKDTKLEKKRRNQLEKLTKALKKNLEAKHQNNYYFDQILAFSRLREDLETGEYRNTQFAVLKHNPLFVDIYKNRKKLAASWGIQLNVDGKAINVYNQARLSEAKGALGRFVNCNQPRNVVEKFITENSKMSLPQARNMLGTLGTIGIVGGLFMLGRWLFTEKDKEGKRKFSLSFWKLAGLIGIPLALSYVSEAGTGKGILENLDKVWRTGEFPRDEKIEQATPVETMAIQQNIGQFALLGVPFGTLKDCVKFKNGVAAEIEAGKLMEYYKGALEHARQRKDSNAEHQIGMQIQALESILQNEKAKIMLNASLANLALQEGNLTDPNNTQLTLDARLYENNQRSKQLELYLKNKILRINPSKLNELNTKLFSSDKALEESDFNDLLKENFFLPNDATYQALEQIASLPDRERILIHEAFELLKKEPSLSDLKLELAPNNQLKLSWNGSELLIDPIKKTIIGLNNAGGAMPFESQKDLMRTAALINTLREHKNIWGEETDKLRKTEKNWPFDVGNSLAKSIYFKKHGGSEVNIISDLVPRFSEMDRNYSTIEADQNREFFVKYLNELWAKDHATTPASTTTTNTGKTA